MSESRKNIVLIGFMGTGKSTVGKTLSKKMGRTLVDIDQRIEEGQKRRIADIFEKDGETVFRDLEKRAIREAVLGSGLVITTGGGAVMDPENLSVLKERGIVILLEAQPDTIYKRVKDSRHRPLLHLPAGQAGSNDVMGEIRRLLAQRQPQYDRADFKFATDGKSAAQVSDEILAKLSEEEEFGKDWF